MSSLNSSTEPGLQSSVAVRAQWATRLYQVPNRYVANLDSHIHPFPFLVLTCLPPQSSFQEAFRAREVSGTYFTRCTASRIIPQNRPEEKSGEDGMTRKATYHCVFSRTGTIATLLVASWEPQFWQALAFCSRMICIIPPTEEIWPCVSRWGWSDAVTGATICLIPLPFHSFISETIS